MDRNLLEKALYHAIVSRFPCYGAGIIQPDNILVSNALKDRPLMFASGTEVEEVISFILDAKLKLEQGWLKHKNAEKSRKISKKARNLALK